MVRVNWTITWKKAHLGKSKDFIMLSGTKYYSKDDLNMEYFKENDHHTTSPDYGQANYYDIVVDGEVYKNGAWHYPECEVNSKDFSNYMAFGEEVKLEV